MERLFDIYREIEDSLSTAVKIGHEQVDYITVARLMTVYNANRERNSDLAESVKAALLFFLTPDEFEQVLEEIETI